MSNLPLFRVKSWEMADCMPYYILIPDCLMGDALLVWFVQCDYLISLSGMVISNNYVPNNQLETKYNKCRTVCLYILMCPFLSPALSQPVSPYMIARARVCVCACVCRFKSLVWCVWVLRKSSLWIPLTHWGRVTHICVSKQTSIGSDNGLSPGRRQAIIWTNAGILLIGPMWTNFSEILIAIHICFFSRKCV